MTTRKNSLISLKNIVLTLLLAGGFAFGGCLFNCTCPDIEGEYFDIEGATIDHFLVDGFNFSECCDGITDIDEYQMYVNFNLSYFDLGFHRNKDSYQNQIPKNKSWLSFPDIQLMPSAMALSCDCLGPGMLGSQEVIENITVKTLNDFDDTHPANSNINEYLNIGINYEDLVPLNDFLAANNDSSFIQSEYMHFNFIQEFTNIIDFQAEITINLTNGETYTVTSEMVTLQ